MTHATARDVLRVRDVMQREPVTIEKSASLRDLAALLSYHGIGGVPVVEHGRRVVGVVSGSDIVRLAAEDDELPLWTRDEVDVPRPSDYFAEGAPRILRGLLETSLAGYRVEDVMTPATLSVREEATIPELAAFLVKTGVHRALVIENGQLRGLVTSMDVMRAVAGDIEPLRPLEREPRNQEVR